MRHTLSSAQTFFMKLVFPTLWLAGFVTGTVLLFLGRGITTQDGSIPEPSMKWFFLCATVVGGLFLYWCCIRLKRVDIDDRWLYVSNYLREIRVPLEHIEDVAENRWVNIRPVTVRFRRETDFGPSITFMPRTRWWGFWRAHPVIGEIETAIRHVRGLPPERPAA